MQPALPLEKGWPEENYKFHEKLTKEKNDLSKTKYCLQNKQELFFTKMLKPNTVYKTNKSVSLQKCRISGFKVS